ncbi:MAG: CoA transferase [Gammaproteobacteria bacterium]|nr:CoA transferase [Gammaproteobacteria bacterium]
MSDTDLPFEGVRVLDLSQGIAGPYCGMHLARNGADVIKLEPVGNGCWSRQLGRSVGDQTAHSLVVHRGKRSLALDLKHPQGLAIAQQMANNSDVILQNYRVGKIDKLGLDYATVARANPSVVYLSITGFGPRGPRADQPATDSVMQAYTGMMSINRDRTGLPQRINMLAIDFATGLYAFQAVSAALYRRAIKGKGKHIRTSLLEAALAFQEAAMMESHLQGGEVEPIGMPVGSFRTADGYMSINARRDPHFKRLCELLGKPEWLEDPRFADARARVEHGEALLAELAPIIESRSSDEWNRLLSGIDVLNAKVHTHHDLFEDEQVMAIDAVHWVEDPTLGRVPMGNIPGQPVPRSGDRLSRSPSVGEHSVEILTSLGLDKPRIDALLDGGVVAQPG